jgi:hypothetical protein
MATIKYEGGHNPKNVPKITQAIPKPNFDYGKYFGWGNYDTPTSSTYINTSGYPSDIAKQVNKVLRSKKNQAAIDFVINNFCRISDGKFEIRANVEVVDCQSIGSPVYSDYCDIRLRIGFYPEMGQKFPVTYFGRDSSLFLEPITVNISIKKEPLLSNTEFLSATIQGHVMPKVLEHLITTSDLLKNECFLQVEQSHTEDADSWLYENSITYPVEPEMVYQPMPIYETVKVPIVIHPYAYAQLTSPQYKYYDTMFADLNTYKIMNTTDTYISTTGTLTDKFETGEVYTHGKD